MNGRRRGAPPAAPTTGGGAAAADVRASAAAAAAPPTDVAETATTQASADRAGTAASAAHAATEALAAAAPVLALLDDATAATLLEWSATLARALRRELALVYVESARSLVAAALPLTCVLAPGGRQWQPLSPPDVEQGFRAQATRLRELAARIAGREALHWSLRTLRGELAEAAHRLGPEADLLLLPPPLALGLSLPASAHHRPTLLVLADEAAVPTRALQVARQLAQALRGSVQVLAHDHERLDTVHADLVVLSRLPDEPARLARLRCPLLRVG